MNANFLDPIPVLVLYAGLLVLFLAAVEFGYLLGDRRQRSTEYEDEGRSTQAGIVLGAMLGLSSFMLGFTFSMAGGQFDDRRKLLIDDINAIGTAFLRTATLPEPHRSTSRQRFADYVERRATLFDEAVAGQLEHSERVQGELFSNATALAREQPTPVVALYVQALNEMIDLHGKRVYVEFFVRIPDMVFVTLAVLSLITLVLAGYLLGLKQRRWGLPTALMIFSYATVFLIVVDLDRPAKGLFVVSGQPMLELRDEIRASVASDAAR